MKQYLLFDTSSLIYALKFKNLSILYNNYIQWLTIYEIINALWKEIYLTKSININGVHNIVSILSNIIDFMKLLSPHPYEHEILTIAKELEVTVYDASYIVLAKNHNLSLVTEDKELKIKANKLVKTISLNEIL